MTIQELINALEREPNKELIVKIEVPLQADIRDYLHIKKLEHAMYPTFLIKTTATNKEHKRKTK